MGSGGRADLPARAASAALITPLAPGAGALRPNYDRSFAPAQSMPLTEALERQIRAPRPGKAAAASGVGDATTHGEMWEAQGCPRLVLSIHQGRVNTSEDLKAPTQLFSSCWTRDNQQQGSNFWSTQP